jgi:hypothetical protein
MNVTARSRAARAAAVVLLASIASLLGAACSGDEPEIEEFATERGGSTITVADDSCSYDGPSRVWSGRLLLDITNDTGEEVTIEVVKIAEGASYHDLMSYIAGENDRVEGGRDPLGEPSFVSVVSQFEVLPPSLQGGKLPTELGAGRYAVLCITGNTLRAIHATAPIEVHRTVVVFDGERCSYTGPTSIPAGPFALDVDNRTTDNDIDVVLGRIAAGRSFDDFQAFMDAESQRLDDGRGFSEYPSWFEVVARAEPLADRVVTMSTTIAEGTYALACYDFTPPHGVDAAAGLDAAW